MGRLALLFWILALGFSAAAADATQSDQALAQVDAGLSLCNVVRIVADGERAAGFVVGRQDNNDLWIATAAHAVFPNPEDQNVLQPTPAQTIEVSFGCLDETWTPASPPILGDDNDLAFLRVRVPLAQVSGVDRWRQIVIEADPEPGSRARIAATPSGIAYGPWDGEIVRAADGRLSITGMTGGQRGQSGAPVFSGRGFVGMYIGSAGSRMIPMSVIEVAARNARVPWQLTAYPPRSIAIRVCLDVSGVPIGTIRLNSTEGGISVPDATGCAATRSGAASLIVDPNYHCTPPALNLPRTVQQRVAVTCMLELAGLWVAGPLGFANIERVGESSWRLTGLDASPVGQISGELTLAGSQVFFSGRDQFGRVVNGRFTLGQRGLSGSLLANGGPISVELAK